MGIGDSLDRKGFEGRAAANVRELLVAERAPALSAEQEAAFDEVVQEATMDLQA